MQWFANLVTQSPLRLLLLIGVLTAASLQGMVDLRSGEIKLSIDPALERLLPEGDAERKFYDTARRKFGSDEFMDIHVGPLSVGFCVLSIDGSSSECPPILPYRSYHLV